MTILVTGALGFIGRHTVEILRLRGHRVIGIDKKAGLNLVEYDNVKALIQASVLEIDYIVHLAGDCSTARSLVNPRQSFLDNVITTFNVAELAKELRVKGVIFSSSVKAYPNSQGIRTPYGVNKFIGEEILWEHGKSFGVKSVINRFGTIYGPGQDASPESGWLTWFIEASLKDSPITIYGDGKQVRDVLYVTDAVNLLIDQVENFDSYYLVHDRYHPELSLFDIGGGQANAVTLLQVLEFIGYNNYTFADERLGDSLRYVATNELPNKRWEPKVGWQDGVRKTIEHYKTIKQ